MQEGDDINNENLLDAKALNIYYLILPIILLDSLYYFCFTDKKLKFRDDKFTEFTQKLESKNKF